MNSATAAPGGMKALGSVYSYTAIQLYSRNLIKADVPVEKLVLISGWKEAGSQFGDGEKAALKWTEVVTQVSDTHVPDEAYTEAHATLTEKQLADLTIAADLMNADNRLAISFRATTLTAAA